MTIVIGTLAMLRKQRQTAIGIGVDDADVMALQQLEMVEHQRPAGGRQLPRSARTLAASN